jgi:hypothetical protein
VAVTGQDRDDHGGEQSTPSSTPWHNRTSAVVGASVLGLAVIAILVLAGTYVARQFGETEQAPLYYVEPSFSATSSGTSTTPTTTTQTITSTVPPVTSDINPSSGPPTSSSDTSSSETPSPETSAEEDEDDEESRLPTTRRTPRTNITRTLYPRP